MVLRASRLDAPPEQRDLSQSEALAPRLVDDSYPVYLASPVAFLPTFLA
jgi:hypothetical protein